ncbi:hypothetical protein R1sor_010670 [Riccia sorocarpa]|uniref:Cytochrome c domain-containing protein n=1 Tax=Riccia sorocarpa TaxID=122646 RepID=A0ABD3I0K3_9MARC
MRESCMKSEGPTVLAVASFSAFNSRETVRKPTSRSDQAFVQTLIEQFPYLISSCPVLLIFIDTMSSFGTLYKGPPGDAKSGEKIFRNKCAECHTVEKVGRHKEGPNLHGLFGRISGTAPGYHYSVNTFNKAVTWDEQTLYEYLNNPQAYIQGTTDVFPGLKKPQERADVIAYLKKSTAT